MSIDFTGGSGSGGDSPVGNNHLAEHLKIIQGVIARMSAMSFLIKGWVIAVFFATMVNAAGDPLAFVVVALFFWVLDAYYLTQERRFRVLYNAVARDDGTVRRFSLDLSPSALPELAEWRNRWASSFLSLTMSLLHLPLIGFALWSYYHTEKGRLLFDYLLSDLMGLF